MKNIFYECDFYDVETSTFPHIISWNLIDSFSSSARDRGSRTQGFAAPGKGWCSAVGFGAIGIPVGWSRVLLRLLLWCCPFVNHS